MEHIMNEIDAQANQNPSFDLIWTLRARGYSKAASANGGRSRNTIYFRLSLACGSCS